MNKIEEFLDRVRKFRHTQLKFEMYGNPMIGREALDHIRTIRMLSFDIAKHIRAELKSVRKQENVDLLDKLLNLKK